MQFQQEHILEEQHLGIAFGIATAEMSQYYQEKRRENNKKSSQKSNYLRIFKSNLGKRWVK